MVEFDNTAARGQQVGSQWHGQFTAGQCGHHRLPDSGMHMHEQLISISHDNGETIGSVRLMCDKICCFFGLYSVSRKNR